MQLAEQAARRFFQPDVTSVFGGSSGHENWRSLLPPLVPSKSFPEILYRQRKLGHKIAGFEASEDIPSQCLQQRVLYSRL